VQCHAVQAYGDVYMETNLCDRAAAPLCKEKLFHKIFVKSPLFQRLGSYMKFVRKKKRKNNDGKTEIHV
jgi:hypothetical protein